ncbi:MAG: alkaline phosphatase family protein [Balneolaceae bacterium]|nr:alkaline phosphatase family protein [Balneolaceae bacterium]
MKVLSIGWLALFMLNLQVEAQSIDTTSNKQPLAKNVVYIILDGISADILDSLETPAIDDIASLGGYTHAMTGGLAGGYSESPTASAIGYNNVLTGVWANKHNVYTNLILNPNYRYWSLYRLIETQKPSLVTALYSSWTDNRTKLIGMGLEEAGSFSIDIVRDGYDVVDHVIQQDSAWVRELDNHVAKEAATSIALDGPDFSWVYLWYPDDTGHSFGETEPHYESIRHADTQVGMIWQSVQQRMDMYDEDWMVVVTTDHGRALPDGRNHGGQTVREKKVWFATNHPGVNEYFYQGDVQHVDLYPSIARYLGVEIPKELSRELDGVSFIGPVDVSSMKASRIGTDRISLSWDSWQTEESSDPCDVDISVTVGDNYGAGQFDTYEQFATVPCSDNQATLTLPSETIDSDTIKVLLESPHNRLNHWIISQ